MISESLIACNKMTKERAHFFTQAEQDLLLEGYEEFQELICKRGNTAKAAQTRKDGWQKVADKLNASNVSTMRTWEQVKVKYKNILQTEGCSSSEPVARCSGHLISAAGKVSSLEPVPDQRDVDQGQIFEDNVSNYSSGGEEAVASTRVPSGTKTTSKKGDVEKNVRVLYKRYLQQKIAYRKLKMRKIQQDMELDELRATKMKLQIQVLEKQLDPITMTCGIYNNCEYNAHITMIYNWSMSLFKCLIHL
ncbi:uncharacterized protein LOC125718119 isoform X3 [Brienomyrus brachyistius]|uniref:uncharacterized protein LOC125718119 isoform X3 n=1 Tax=Brienomyrus brachyistius TaxID=42636 RepID=UPI0020B31316|nr:uncharacterized protein LOC125718119 isoform X3 [Brienomyrus brachyistius]